MTDTSFPTHEGYALPCLISASVALAAVMVAMVAILTMTSGAAGSSERGVFTTASDHASPMARSGTLQALQIVY